MKIHGAFRQLLAFTIISFLQFSCTPRQGKIECKVLKSAKLKYTVADDTSAYIVISDNKHVEYYNNNQDSIVSKLEWLNDCEYNAIFLESSLTGFALKAGEKLNVKFDKIEDYTVYCATKLGNRVVEQKFKLLSFKD